MEPTVPVTKTRQIFYILGVLVCIIVVIALIYPNYSGVNTKKIQLSSQKALELSKLVLDNHNCEKAITEAKSFLASNGDSVDVLSILGGCEFDMGRFDDAKTTFQKVLALDPENAGAKSYISNMNFKKGEVVVTVAESPLDKTTFESRMGTNFDEMLTFVSAMSKPSSIPEYMIASYTTSKKRTEVIAFIKKRLGKGVAPVTVSETGSSTIIATRDTKEMKFVEVGNVKGTTISVNMNYQKFTQ